MGWFRSEKEILNSDNAFDLRELPGKILYASNIEIEDEGEFVIFTANTTIEQVEEEEEIDECANSAKHLS